MKFTTGELTHAFNRERHQPTEQQKRMMQRENYLRSLQGQYTIEQMITLLGDTLGQYITPVTMRNFCNDNDIPWYRPGPGDRVTRRGKGIDIHTETSNGKNKVSYITTNQNDYQRFN